MKLRLTLAPLLSRALVAAACNVGTDPSAGADAGTTLDAAPSPPSPPVGAAAGDAGSTADSDASPLDAGDAGDAADAGCPLANAWTALPQGSSIATAEEMTSGDCTYRFDVFSKPSGGPTPPLQQMFLEKLDAPGRTCPAPKGFIEVGGCQTNPAPHCTWQEPEALSLRDDGGRALLVTLTQLHNLKYGYGSFDLLLRDGESGALLKKALPRSRAPADRPSSARPPPSATTRTSSSPGRATWRSRARSGRATTSA
jgi:hypothetical protein